MAVMSEPRQRVAALATPDEAAEFLGCSRVNVYAMMNAGELKYIRLRARRRIRWSDLERIVAEGTVPAESMAQ